MVNLMYVPSFFLPKMNIKHWNYWSTEIFSALVLSPAPARSQFCRCRCRYRNPDFGRCRCRCRNFGRTLAARVRPVTNSCRCRCRWRWGKKMPVPVRELENLHFTILHYYVLWTSKPWYQTYHYHIAISTHIKSAYMFWAARGVRGVIKPIRESQWLLAWRIFGLTWPNWEWVRKYSSFLRKYQFSVRE